MRGPVRSSRPSCSRRRTRLAHGGRAHLELLGKTPLGDLLTGPELARGDRVGETLPGLYAAGEIGGFGGGGMMGYNALEGTFLGGCLFSGRVAGRAAADQVG